MLMRQTRWFAVLAVVSGVSLANVDVHAQPGSTPARGVKGANAPTKLDLSHELDGLWNRLGSQEPLPKLAIDAENAFRMAVAFAPISGDGAKQFTEAAALRRLLNQLNDSRNRSAPAVRPVLAANPQLARRIALTVKPQDDIGNVYARLDELSKQFPNDIADKGGAPNLAAAICVVFDQQRRHPTHGGASANAVETFGYFRTNASRMNNPLDKMPSELGVWVVSVNCTLPELQWALQLHAGDRAVGKLFDKITYDTEHLKRGTTKKVLASGEYTLPSIRKYGGVCTEQGYYASECAKAIGVPATYVRAFGSDLGHAWVGYLKSDRTWDFKEGRDAGDGQYEDLTGEIVDPQTLLPTTDAAVALTAGLINISEENRDLSVALNDAVEYVMQQRKNAGAKWPPVAPEGVTTKPRDLNVAAEFELLEGAAKASPQNQGVWRTLAAISAAGDLNDAQRQKWGDMLLKACGKPSADFAVEILTPMIKAVEPVQSQSKMWDWVAQQFQQRPDLAARARMEQGEMWRKAKDPAKAWTAYNEVVQRFANEGDVLLPVLGAMEKLLTEQGKPQAAVGLYEDAFRRVSKPKSMGSAFWRGSNYYKVGARYSDLLRDAGKKSDADRIEKMIEPKKDKGGL